MSSKGFKIASMIVAFVMLFSLFGCSATPTAAPAAPTTAVSASEATATTAPAEATKAPAEPTATSVPESAKATAAPATPVDVSKLPKLSFSVTTVGFGVEPTDKEVQKLWLQKSSEMMGNNLDIQFQWVSENDYQEKIKVILASGELPDLISLDWLSQSEIVKYGDAGLFVDLSKYLDKMPNYKKLLDEAPSSKPNLISKEGKLYAVYSATTNSLVADGGHDLNYVVGIRKDIFDKNNIAIPTTLDELTAAAEQLKKIYPDKYPISPNSSWETPWSLLVSTNHCGSWDQYRYYDGITFQYAPLQECMKDAVTTMNLWVKEKLVAPDFMSFTDAQGTAALAAGDAMILPGMWYGYPGFWETQYPEQKWVTVTGISNPKYGKPWVFGTYTKDATSFITNYSIAISAKSKHIDDLVKFLDIQLSQEISTVINWGVEGKTYKVVNGVNTFLPEYLKAQSDTKDPLNAANMCIGTGSCRPGIFPQIQDNLANLAGWPEQDSIVDGKPVRAIIPAVKKDYFNPAEENPSSVVKVSPLTTDEANEYANIMTPIDTYAKAQVAQFIMGKRPMSDWDKFVGEVKAMGDIQRALQLYISHLTK